MKTAHVVPVAFSAAGFKALPYRDPPVLPLQGLVVLMGTNSSGKSTLLLALRLLVASLMHEPRLERLHLRAPGLASPKLLFFHDVWNKGPFGPDGRPPLTFRFTFSDATMLECRFDEQQPAHSAYGPTSDPPEDQRERGYLQPLTLTQVEEEGLRVFRADPHGPSLPPWHPHWTAFDLWDGQSIIESRLRALHWWAFRVAFLDPIRHEQVIGLQPAMLVQNLDSTAITADGSNAGALLALTHDGGYGDTTWSVTDEDCHPGTTIPRFFPNPTAIGPSRDPIDLVSHLLESCGLERLSIAGHAPGCPSELRSLDTRMSLAHLGDGQRQLLPALVQALFSEPGITLAWEHPDLHLHPGASTGLGRIAYRLAGAGRTVIIETHNQDLVSGICSEAAAVRVRHARTSGDEGLELSHAVLIYLRRQDSGCAHESYRLDDPEVELPMWPGFFDLEVIDRRRFEQSMSPIFSPTDAAHVRKLLSRGEGQSIEFKATLAWNLETGAKDPEIVYSAMRTIAAFCNSCEGGFLLIGVDDKATPVGLDPCFDGRDAFQKRLIEAVREWFPAFPALFESHLAISFERVDERDVAVVQCRPAKEPVFLYDVRKQREVILIRVGCTSQPLPSGQEAKWMKDRFSS